MKILCSIIAGCIISVSLLAQEPTLKEWPECGNDHYINSVLEKLNGFYKIKSAPAEASLIETLNPLFQRRAFFEVRHEEEMAEYVWALRKTRSIIEFYQNHNFFKTYKLSISKAINMIKRMEKKASQAFSKSISIDAEFEKHQNNHSGFINALGVYKTMSMAWKRNRNKEICDFRSVLKDIGLVNALCENKKCDVKTIHPDTRPLDWGAIVVNTALFCFQVERTRVNRPCLLLVI